jgi:hypothetical protein
VLLDGLRMSPETGPLDLMAAIQFDTMTASSRESLIGLPLRWSAIPSKASRAIR